MKDDLPNDKPKRSNCWKALTRQCCNAKLGFDSGKRFCRIAASILCFYF